MLFVLISRAIDNVLLDHERLLYFDLGSRGKDQTFLILLASKVHGYERISCFACYDLQNYGSGITKYLELLCSSSSWFLKRRWACLAGHSSSRLLSVQWIWDAEKGPDSLQ